MSNRSPNDNVDDRILEEAADWLTRLREVPVSEADNRAFTDWLMKSTDHLREFLRLSLLSEDISRLPQGNVPLAGEIPAIAQAPNVIPLFDQSQPAPRRHGRRQTLRHRRRFFAIAAAAMVATIAIGLPWLKFAPTAETIKTGIGIQVSHTLEDGSLISLNAETKVRLAYSKRFRDIHLLYGEALFDVEKDPTRPFRVIVGGTQVQAVGTAFNIRHRRQQTAVTVVSGKVDVALDERSDTKPIERLSPGQQARIQPNSTRIDIVSIDPARATAWRERELYFDALTLAEAVEEFNRHNRSKIVIASTKIAHKKISGHFQANDRESFAQFLQAANLAKVTIDTSGAMVLSDNVK